MTIGVEPSGYVARNRAHWDKLADKFVAPGERAWCMAPDEERWGILASRRLTFTSYRTMWQSST